MSRQKPGLLAVSLIVFLAYAASAQTTPSTSSDQPSAAAQNQSSHEQSTSDSQSSQTPADTKKDSTDKKDKDYNEGSHKTHIRLSTVTVAGGYSHFSGPFFYAPYGPYGFWPYGYGYSPFFYGPFYSFYGPYGSPFLDFHYRPDKGEVNLKSNSKNAEVYLDSAYAGTADHLKNFWLDPGAYDLSVSAPDHAPFQQRIYVLSGKSLKIDARLQPQKAQSEKGKTEEKR